jgi:hypothetical protein
MDEGRGGLLSAGGILSIIVGAFEAIGGGIMVALVCLRMPFSLWRFYIFRPGMRSGPITFWEGGTIGVDYTWWIIIGGLLFVLGIIAIAGGVSAIRRKSFGLSLAGAICALIPLNLVGLLAVIFVSLGKREF